MWIFCCHHVVVLVCLERNWALLHGMQKKKNNFQISSYLTDNEIRVGGFILKLIVWLYACGFVYVCMYVLIRSFAQTWTQNAFQQAGYDGIQIYDEWFKFPLVNLMRNFTFIWLLFLVRWAKFYINLRWHFRRRCVSSML